VWIGASAARNADEDNTAAMLLAWKSKAHTCRSEYRCTSQKVAPRRHANAVRLLARRLSTSRTPDAQDPWRSATERRCLGPNVTSAGVKAPYLDLGRRRLGPSGAGGGVGSPLLRRVEHVAKG
jgi:hypothetical protein